MNANVLRIGNLVLDNVSNTIKVVFEVASAWDTAYVRFQNEMHRPLSLDISRVALTEEWILAFGYKKVNTLHDQTSVFEKKGSYTIYFLNGILSLSFKTKEIKYVHEFQNLYFALTGEELKYEKK